jgi:hypothetical protein
VARSLAIVLAVALSGIGAIILPFAEVAYAQQFPASAVIRGENIRLRLEPAEETDNVAILQRGDQITITGDVTAADGLAFYPVEVEQTGDAGWVRDLFINPRSIVPLVEPAPALEPAPEAEPEAEPAPDASAEDGNNQRRERPARQNRQNRQAAAEGDEAAAEDDAAAAEEDADQAAADDAAAEEPADGAADEPVATAAGVGTARSERFALEPGRYRVNAAMEVSAATGFTCELFGPDDFTETLFDEQIDEPQSWTAQTRLRLDSGGDFYVECADTDEEWTITFTPA